MKFSEQWLREWVNPALTTKQLADSLSLSGLEVESIEPVAASFQHVVVGEAVHVERHPNADKLHICKVEIGKEQPLSIVCGAANIRSGLKIAVALVGATLPNGLTIKKAKLRGLESEGMICSEVELGLAEQSVGIMELPLDAPVGEDFRRYLQLDDHVIDLNLTPNRGDCLSIQGVAREAAAIHNCKVYSKKNQSIQITIKDSLSVTLKEEQACPHYTGRLIRGVNPKAKTPLWLHERLRRSGIRAIHPVVDVANYVMLELGEPLHGFDADKLKGSIVVRFAIPNEKITLLGGQTVHLDNQTLVIADQQSALAVAGIMGGADSAISAATTNIFLESAYFDPVIINQTTQRYQLHTDSSFRFARGVDWQIQTTALERATELILAIVGGQAGPITTVQSQQFQPKIRTIQLRQSRISRVLGVSITDKEIERILSSLGMAVQSIAAGWQVIVPAYRHDIALEIDLIEEIARLHGYDKIPDSQATQQTILRPFSRSIIYKSRLHAYLTDHGYHQTINYSFIDPQWQQRMDAAQIALRLKNPLTSEMAILRTSLWPGLLQSLRYNLARQQERLKLYEIATCFLIEDQKIKEQERVAGIIYGNVYPKQWGILSRSADFFDVKGDLAGLLQSLKITDISYDINGLHPSLHPKQAVTVRCNGKKIGYLGILHPSLQQELELPQAVCLFELETSIFNNKLQDKYKVISKFPSVQRDLSVLIDESVTAQTVQDKILSMQYASLNKVEIFDIYRGKGVDSDKKSVALSLTFLHPLRTLVDEEIDAMMGQIVDLLRQAFHATLRE